MATAKERYEELALRREPFLQRARRAAELTLPSLLPPEHHNHTDRLPEPYQGLGSRCVVNLSSRLLTALLPPGTAFFKLQIPNAALIESGQLSPPADLELGFSLAEKLIMSEIDRANWRSSTNLALQLLIVTGNALEYIGPDNQLRVYRLDQYVIERDLTGAVKEIIVRQKIPPELSPVQTEIKSDLGHEFVELYTIVKRNKQLTYDVHQEVEGQIVPKSKGTYSVSPFIPLRWSLVPAEDYGRGKVEEHYADLFALDGMAKALLDGSTMASRHIWMIRPNATGANLRRRMAEADNGEIVVGNPEDVSMMQFTNVTGLQIAAEEVRRLTEVLSTAFLLNSGMRRNAERVTATELRMVAEELEGTLGGVYSMLSQEMQRTRLQRLMLQMIEAGQLPPFESDLTEIQITTGLEALGREQDVAKVQAAAQIVQMLTPELTLDYVKMTELLKRAFNGLGLPEVVRSEPEAQQIRQQRMQAEQQQQMGQMIQQEVAPE
tara:strand:- start:1331 stop:2809 length:1479 start_codon:yes stop_codon:yes gene_type:complete